MRKKVIFGILSLIIVLLLSNVLAITGSIGNARMILRANVNDKIEKYILVKNVNDVAVDIELSVTGELSDYTDIKDNKFTLQPNTEKKAYFTIKAAKAGTTETKINVQFIPQDSKTGVGLSSTVIVIAGGEDDKGWFDWNDEEGEDGGNESEDNEEVVSVTTGKTISKMNKKTSLIAVALSITAVVFIILVVLLVITSKTGGKKEKLNLKKRVEKRG